MAPGSSHSAGTPPVRLLFCRARIWRRGKAPGEPQEEGSEPPTRLFSRRLHPQQGKGTMAGVESVADPRAAASSRMNALPRAHQLQRSQDQQVWQACKGGAAAAPNCGQAAAQAVAVDAQEGKLR